MDTDYQVRALVHSYCQEWGLFFCPSNSDNAPMGGGHHGCCDDLTNLFQEFLKQMAEAREADGKLLADAGELIRQLSDLHIFEDVFIGRSRTWLAALAARSP